MNIVRTTLSGGEALKQRPALRLGHLPRCEPRVDIILRHRLILSLLSQALVGREAEGLRRLLVESRRGGVEDGGGQPWARPVLRRLLDRSLLLLSLFAGIRHGEALHHVMQVATGERALRRGTHEVLVVIDASVSVSVSVDAIVIVHGQTETLRVVSTEQMLARGERSSPRR
jgi:hypothetical protein